MVGRSLYFGPVLDQHSLPRHPFYPDAPPQSANIPMIIGNTRDETIAFLGNEPGIRELSWEALPERLLPQLHVDIDPEYVIATYRRLYPQYTPTQKSSLRQPPQDVRGVGPSSSSNCVPRRDRRRTPTSSTIVRRWKAGATAQCTRWISLWSSTTSLSRIR